MSNYHLTIKSGDINFRLYKKINYIVFRIELTVLTIMSKEFFKYLYKYTFCIAYSKLLHDCYDATLSKKFYLYTHIIQHFYHTKFQ